MKNRGFTLSESLIGLVLLSLGMLGAWAMLLSSLRSHGDALYRAAATNLLRDMGDRIRANPGAGALYDTRLESPGVEACEAGTSCDMAQTAAADLAHFARRASELFPAPGLSTRIEFEPATGPATTDRFHLVLEWSGPRDTGVGNAVTLELLAQPGAG